MTIKEYLKGNIHYEETMIFVENSEYVQRIADIRGWGRMQNLFKRPNGEVDFVNAAKFQDSLGQFITEAIKEKLERL